MSFVHLHVHSEYSLLDGFSNIKKLIQRAKEMEMPAIGLTDHGTMFGAIEFYNTATEAGIKPIVGVEAYLAARSMKERDAQLDKRSSHLLLLAENQTGYQNLLKIASAAQLDGFYYYPRVDHEFLSAHSEGLICTSGCMSAEVPRLIQAGNVEKARRQLDWYYEVFGADRFYLELQSHNIPELKRINKQLVDLGRRYEAQFVATNDVHYVDKADARLQDILLAIQTGCVLSDPNRMRMTDPSYYLRSAQEMKTLFSGVPGAIDNTLLIAERCSVDLGFKGYRLPEFDVPEGYDAESYLRKLCEDGLERCYGARATNEIVRERLDYELGIIHQMGFDAYFLIVWDLCRHAAERGIWYNARGSAAGSIVAFTLAITMVDPLDHGLIFERFLNPGRVSMPDIDLDFPDDRRAEMMVYTAEKYGDDKVAQIITFGTLGARAAIRDVGRVMDIPLNEVDKVAKLVPNIPGKAMSIETALEEVPDFKKLYNDAPYLQELIDTAKHMEGVVRNAGTHAAGVIVTDKPVIDYLPLHRPTGSAQDSPIKTVTQFEMNILDSLGLLKVDFLGLATLTIMSRACDLIRERHGVEFDLYNIPVDDPATYELLGRGETAGVFQVEGSGMRRWLVEMKPHSLANVIAMVALFRPGPMDFIPGYIRRMHGEEKVTYRHPLLEDIFEETYGYPVYQEQLMFAVMKLAEYTPPEADDLRKAIAKKIPEKLQKHRKKFIAGSVKNDIDEQTAAEIFDDWEEFARYGFNKSHAVDYGIIAVQTAYLKTHYPVEYMTALLSVSKNDTGKVSLYAADCRRMNITVGPPDVNISEWDFTIEDCEGQSSIIRFGLGAVKNVGLGPVDAILAGRTGAHSFKDLNDFVRNVDLRQVGRRALESLIKVGALDSFGSRVALLEAMDQIVAVSTSHFKAAESGQLSLFGEHTGVMDVIELPAVHYEIGRREVLGWERELIGLYVSDHPLNPIMETLDSVVTHYSGQLVDVPQDEHVRLAGLITRVRHHQTRTGKPMGFVTIEDLQGVVELVIFPRTWKRVAEIVQIDAIVLVDGRVDPQSGDAKLLVDNITTEFSMLVPTTKKPIGPAASASERPPPPQPVVTETRTAVSEHAPGYEAPAEPITQSGEPRESDPIDEPDWDDIPPIPEPPENWIEDGFLDFGEAAEKVGGLAKKSSSPRLETVDTGTASLGPAQSADDEAHLDGSATTTPLKQGQGDEEEKTPVPPVVSAGSRLHTFMMPPRPAEGDEGDGTVRMLTVILRSTGDKMRDVLRLRRIHGIISTYPGQDRFAIHIFERGHGFLLEFPNFTCGTTRELLDRLNGLLGAENINVETITFQ